MDKIDRYQDEKVLLVSPSRSSSYKKRTAAKFLALGACLLLGLHQLTNHYLPFQDGDDQSQCSQEEPLIPKKHSGLALELGDLYDTDAFKLRAVDWIAGAVRIPTEAYDGMDDVGVDPRWEIFAKFHEHLEKAFPLVHQNLTLTKVNTYGLVYTWTGSDEHLKPLLLMGHQDVVPVEPNTVDSWTHPPYSGHFDGTYVWGRGSVDDKSGLVGSLSAAETLLESGFRPTRSVILAFGFDEEVSGTRGARFIAAHLLETLGPDSIAMLIDEGNGYLSTQGALFALPAVAEKGYIDVKVEVSSAGGHSSVPPAHTGIGFLSSLLAHVESHPHPSHLSRSSPIFAQAQCFGRFSPDIPKPIRKAIKHALHSDRALRQVEEYLVKDNKMKAALQTTQAVTVIRGGVKSNALPEQAWAIINHRIATDSSLAQLKKEITHTLAHKVKAAGASLTAFGTPIFKGTDPRLHVSLTDAWDSGLNPAPISKTSSDAYKILAGTIRSTHLSRRFKETHEELLVSPSVPNGNTDTRWYWTLTPNIYRYGHLEKGPQSGIHTVNEALDAVAFTQQIKFFTNLILNADESSTI